MAANTTPRILRGQIGAHGTWIVLPCTRRRHCTVDNCPNTTTWKGLVGAQRFETGRVCDDHWTNLVRVTKNLADGWQPAPRYVHC